MIPLPPLTALKSCQNKVFWTVAMPSSPPDQEDQDWVVAIKFLGRQLSLCSPHRDLRWTNIVTPLDFSENSNLMFSKRDQRFYLPAPGGNHLFSYDLNFKQVKNPNFHELQFRDLPELPQSKLELLYSCCRTEYLVESVSTGEHFLVRRRLFKEWAGLQDKAVHGLSRGGDDGRKKKHVLHRGHWRYLHLQPNSIYYIGHGFGIYDLSTGTTRLFRPPAGAPNQLTAPYWLSPFYI
ncbi:hypothetical protein ISN44_As06g028380 [Arabidopsis suecica]|uniref:Uncharacterized protein n=1 Tax=Arabidopsis suecica TaxID=45249 RepID=A0A8T2CKC2_ARASU|nr:hypothetical protein ISN44_As06g028380 [Arabidopsis suecica]